jgi:DNA-binding MarR family transcriptional regulator
VTGVSVQSDPDDKRNPWAWLDAMDDSKEHSRGALAEPEIAARFREQYPRFQYAMVDFIAEHLADVSRVFGGDLQQPLILAVLGQRHLHWMADAQRLDGADPDWSPTMTASRIADVTGVPRETVRRKLSRLEAQGWIARSADGAYRLAQRDGATVARADLSDLDQRSIDRAARLLAMLRSQL